MVGSMVVALVFGAVGFAALTVCGWRVERSGSLKQTRSTRVTLGGLLILTWLATLAGFWFAAMSSVSWE